MQALCSNIVVSFKSKRRPRPTAFAQFKVNLPLNSQSLDRAFSTQPYSPDLVVDRSVTAFEKGLAAPVTFGPQSVSVGKTCAVFRREGARSWGGTSRQVRSRQQRRSFKCARPPWPLRFAILRSLACAGPSRSRCGRSGFLDRSSSRHPTVGGAGRRQPDAAGNANGWTSARRVPERASMRCSAKETDGTTPAWDPKEPESNPR